MPNHDEWTVSEHIYRLKAFYRYLDTLDDYIAIDTAWPSISAADYRNRDWDVARIDVETGGRRVFSPEEVEQLLEHVPEPVTRNRLLIRLMLCTGMRPGEAGELRLDSVDEDSRRIRINQFKADDRTRPVVVPRSLMPLYREWVYDKRAVYRSATESPYVFPSRKSEKLDSSAVGEVVRKAADRSGVEPSDDANGYLDSSGRHRNKYTASVCRRTFAVRFIERGGDLYTLKELLGHKPIKTTLKYVKEANVDSMLDQMEEYGPEF